MPPAFSKQVLAARKLPDARWNQFAAKPSKVWLVLDSLHCGHDFVLPTARDFRGRFPSEVLGNVGFEIRPELTADPEAHETLAARANPLCRARSQYAAVAGRAEPLFKASSTHCW